MATAIATIPVLTGDVAERFEKEAQATYERSLNRTETEKKELAERNRRGMEMVRKMLAKSNLDTR
jgi:hypothetical protein